jgi:hypothetical protein
LWSASSVCPRMNLPSFTPVKLKGTDRLAGSPHGSRILSGVEWGWNHCPTPALPSDASGLPSFAERNSKGLTALRAVPTVQESCRGKERTFPTPFPRKARQDKLAPSVSGATMSVLGLRLDQFSGNRSEPRPLPVDCFSGQVRVRYPLSHSGRRVERRPSAEEWRLQQ